MRTAADNPKIVVLTGASDGIGAAAARALARQGHEVVPIGRSAAKTRAIAAELGTDGHLANFAHLDQVRVLARELASRYPRIDVLINNAGLIGGNKRTITDDGHELTFQVNHLAPFLLATSLHDQLVACGGRVITTSSAANTAGDARIALDDLDMNDNYDAFRAYKASKLANVLFTRELDRRWGPGGVSAAAFHPGLVRTQWGHSGPTAVRLVMRSPLRYAMRSPKRGADTLIWLATTSPGTDWHSGGYYSNRKPATPNPLAAIPELAADLWDRSESMTRAEAH
jgi:NAD(P)-dependent dehydrogenase (short-subunit alcohol dehydrogenase family)